MVKHLPEYSIRATKAAHDNLKFNRWRNKLMTEKYQGWTNYPTWVTKAWLDNDESLYYAYQELNKEHKDIKDLACGLKDWIYSFMPTCDGLAADLFEYVLVEVINWEEIAREIREDFPIAIDEDEDEDNDDDDDE
jgi:hypothetical protein